MKITKTIILLVIAVFCFIAMTSQENQRWSKEKAKRWYALHHWISGADFIVSTAINQLEMWQKDSFDPETIDRELGYAEGIGFNTMRVYLHSLDYKADNECFKNYVNQYLNIADDHKIKTIFVIFDDVWDANPIMGKQPQPKTGTHNSGWVQDPGYPASKETYKFADLKTYVKDIMKTFANDDRILLWDLYSEPANNGKGNESMSLVKAVFTCAREIKPSQPISAGLWKWDLEDLNTFQAQHSDIMTYHDYETTDA